MKRKCLIVDDEPLARSLIRYYIESMETLEVVAECSDALKALDVLHSQKIDLMFIDIQMPQITGIEFLKTLKQPPKVIITTAFRDYAIEGFELDVIDYLLKPLTFERFLKSVNKYFQLSGNEFPVTSPSFLLSEENFIYVKENKRLVKLILNDILFIEGLGEYVKIHTMDKKIITRSSMSALEVKLPESEFLRIHKSYIVSIRKIKAFSNSIIEVGGKEFPVGRIFKDRVVAVLQKDGITAN